MASTAGAPPAAAAADRSTLQSILNDAILSRAYEEFSRREHNDENLQVLRRIHAFSSEGSSADKARAGVSIINKFVRSGSANTDAKTRATLDAVARKVQSLQIGGAVDFSEEIATMEQTFDKWRAIATRELVADSLPRFLASELYTTALEESRAAAASRPAVERRGSMAARARGMLVSLGQSMRLSVSVPSTAADGSGVTSAVPAIEVDLNLTTPADRKRSLLDLLAHPRSRAAFVDFCAKELCDENVALLLDIHAFRCAPDDASRAALAKRMLNTYIRSGSPREANIDSRTRMDAEAMLFTLAGTGAAPGSAPAATSADGEDALVRVETELVNMLSGELLPRFAVSKAWLDLQAASAGGDRSRSSSLQHSSAPTLRAAAAAASVSSSSSTSAGPDIVAEWVAALADEDSSGAAGATAGGRSLLSLRDKYYVFGVSMTAAIRSFGGGPKKADLEAVGAEIRRTSVKSGYLTKRAHHKPSWKRRWFVLTPSVLAYFPDASVSTPSGAFLVKEMKDIGLEWSFTGEPTPPDLTTLPYAFVVHTPHRRYALQAASTKERDRWILALSAARTGNPAAITNADWNADAFKIAAQAVLDRMPQLPLADIHVLLGRSHSDSTGNPPSLAEVPTAAAASVPQEEAKALQAAEEYALAPIVPDSQESSPAASEEAWDTPSPVAAAPAPAATALLPTPAAVSEEGWGE